MTYRKRDYFAIAVMILGLVLQFGFYKTHISELIHVAKWDNLYFYRAATESIEGFLLVLLFFLQFLILACMLFALIMAVARKPRVALWFNWITVFVWVGTVFLWMIYFTLTGHTGYFGPARIFIRVISGQLYTGNALFNAYQNCKFFPLIPLLILVGILLAGSRRHIQLPDLLTVSPSSQTLIAENQSYPAMPIPPQLIPAAPVVVGMKKCPDCAELIQGEAVKCRFCNYRYE